MKITKRTLLGWGAVALAITLLILAAPKAAHAIVATLVQVANTSANPAITQDVSKLASQNVRGEPGGNRGGTEPEREPGQIG